MDFVDAPNGSSFIKDIGVQSEEEKQRIRDIVKEAAKPYLRAIAACQKYGNDREHIPEESWDQVEVERLNSNLENEGKNSESRVFRALMREGYYVNESQLHFIDRIRSGDARYEAALPPAQLDAFKALVADIQKLPAEQVKKIHGAYERLQTTHVHTNRAMGIHTEPLSPHDAQLAAADKRRLENNGMFVYKTREVLKGARSISHYMHDESEAQQRANRGGLSPEEIEQKKIQGMMRMLRSVSPKGHSK